MGKRVIYVNPVTMSTEAWGQYLENTKSRIRSGEEVNNLVNFCFTSCCKGFDKSDFTSWFHLVAILLCLNCKNS